MTFGDTPLGAPTATSAVWLQLQRKLWPRLGWEWVRAGSAGSVYLGLISSAEAWGAGGRGEKGV